MHFRATFKRFAQCFALIAVVLVITSCSYIFDEKKEVRVAEVQSDLGNSLERANQLVSEYFDGSSRAKILEQDIDFIVETYQQTIVRFNKYTISGGQDSDVYTPENIDALVRDSFSDVQFTLGNIRAFLKLRGFLFGGSQTTVTKGQLMQIHDLLPFLGRVAAELEPYRAVLFGEQKPDQSKESYQQFKQAFKTMNFKIEEVLAAIDQYSGKRKMNINQLAKILMVDLFQFESDQVKTYAPLVEAFKNFALNQQGVDLNRNDFSPFVMQTLLAYEGFKNYKYFIEQEGENKVFANPGHIASFMVNIKSQLFDSSIFKTITLKAVSDVVSIGEVVFTRSFNRDPERRIQFSKFRDLLLATETAGGFNGTLTAPTLAQFLEKVSRKWLAPGQSSSSDFDTAKLNYTKKMIFQWFDRQKVVNDLFDGRDEEISLLEIERDFKTNPLIENWVDIFKNTALHQWSNKGRVFFTRNIRNFTYEELTVANSLQTLIELFTKPFNLDRNNLRDFAIKKENSQEIYESLRILGVEMAFMDSRSFTTGQRAFVEGNNFTTQRRSDELFDFYEMYEYLSILLSAGTVSDEIYAGLPKDQHLDYKDVHHKFVTPKNVFYDFMDKNFDKYFTHLSVVKNYWQQAGKVERQKFLGSLEYASRGGVIRDKPVDMVEIRIFVSILYYLESIFYMFDENRDGINSGQELHTAEVHFKNFIADLILEKRKELIGTHGATLRAFCGSDSTDRELALCLAPKLFIHLLNGYSVPGGANWDTGAFLTLMPESWEKEAFAEAQADPQQVLWVFSTLAKVNYQSHVESIRSFLYDKNNRQKLFEELSQPQAPECRQPEDAVFCRWARILYCNEPVNDRLFTYFRDHRYTYFNRPDWGSDSADVDKEPQNPHFYDEDSSYSPDEVFSEVMTTMTSNFKAPIFSTYCSLPQYDEKTFSEWLYDGGVEFFNGTPEKKGVTDKVKEWWQELW